MPTVWRFSVKSKCNATVTKHQLACLFRFDTAIGSQVQTRKSRKHPSRVCRMLALFNTSDEKASVHPLSNSVPHVALFGLPPTTQTHSPTEDAQRRTIGKFLCTFGRQITFNPTAHTSPVKILQISSAQSMGGGERHLADLANGLAGRGHEVYLALRPNSPMVAELKNVGKESVTTLPLRNSLDAKSARELSKLVRKNQIQIVHAHMARDYPLAAYAVRQNKEARLIVTRHVLFPLSRLHRITLSGARE